MQEQLLVVLHPLLHKNNWIFNAVLSLTNFEIQKYENESRFNGVFPRDNLPKKINDGAYVINLDELKDTATHFNCFGVEYIPEEIKKFIGNKNIKANIF